MSGSSATIRAYRADDLERIKAITVVCFEGVAIDHNIEQRFGRIADHDWKWRKSRHLDDDVAGDRGEGVFVGEIDGVIQGYVTCRLDPSTSIGRIPNIAVMPEARGQGLGKQLMEHALAYFKMHEMQYAKIETLDQNPIGQEFYPSMGFKEVGRQIHYLKAL